MPGLAPWRFRAIPCFQLGILHPSLPGLVQPTTKTFAYKTKRPGGLPCELFVSATKDQQGITIRTMGCSLMGPRHGPNVKAGVGADVHWEGNTITVRKQKFRLGVVGAGFSGYVDFRLDGAVRAKIGRKAFVDGHPVLFLMLDRQLRPPRVQQLPQS
jgi:hypothetical protein